MPRAVVIDEGVIVADGPTRELLTDRALMAAHRLEFPGGLDGAHVVAAMEERRAS